MPSMELKSISGKGIKSLALFQKPSLYAVISLTNVNQPTEKRNKKKTSVDRSNGENPVWDQPIRIDIDISHKQDLILQFDLKAEAILGSRVVGRAFIPVADLDFSGTVQHVSYQLKTPEGKANGAINFSYKVDGPGAAASPPIVPAPTLGVGYSSSASFAPSAPPVSAYPPQPEATSGGYYPTVDPVVAYPPPAMSSAVTYPPPPPQSSAGYYPKMEPGVSYPPLPPDGGYPPQPEYCCREIPQPAPNVGGYYPPPAYPPQPDCCFREISQPAPNVGGYYPPPAYPPQPKIPQPALAWYYPSAQQPAPGSYYPPPPPPPDVYGYRQQGWDRGMYGYN